MKTSSSFSSFTALASAAVSSSLLLLCEPASADWQFKSRSDLAPPRLNITIPSSDSSQGYLFLSPFAGHPDTPTRQYGPRQAGPYIFRDDGELVWSGYAIYSIWATNFQAARYRGKNVLFSFEGDHNAGYGHGHGHVTIMDEHYETIRELRAGNHKLVDKHEFHVVPGDDVEGQSERGLIQVYQPVVRNLSKWGGKREEGQVWIVDAIFQELDIATGELLFEWSSLDHVSPDEAILPLNPGQAGSGFNSSDAWDYFHINSVDKHPVTGDYLISARDACSIHKINGTSGEIIWKLHGLDSTFSVPDDAKFCFQHHARWLEYSSSSSEEEGEGEGDDVEIISLYDNSAHGTEHASGSVVVTAPTSSGKIIKLNTTSWEAELLRVAFPPNPQDPDLLSKSQGSTQVLPNGNMLVNWGSEGAITEYMRTKTTTAGGDGDGDGEEKAVFHARMDSGDLGLGVQNYRGFRFNWTGFPNEEPALVALLEKKRSSSNSSSGSSEEKEGGNNEKNVTTAYVSWNGDTETKVWRFYGVVVDEGEQNNNNNKKKKKVLLGEAERKGFETSFVVPEDGLKNLLEGVVVAEAVDGRGRVLRVSRAARIEKEILPLPPPTAPIGGKGWGFEMEDWQKRLGEL